MPLKSRLLNDEGQKLIAEDVGDIQDELHEDTEIDPAEARRRDLFTCGTSAQVRRAYGRSKEEAILEVEGVRRFKLERVTQKRPFFEAEIQYMDDEGKVSSPLQLEL